LRIRPPRPCRDCGKTFVPSWPSTIRCDDCHAALSPDPRLCCDCGVMLPPRRLASRRCDDCHKLRLQRSRLAPVIVSCHRCGEMFERRKSSRATACAHCRSRATKENKRIAYQKWKSENPEKRAAQKKRHRERNRLHVREYKRAYDLRTRRDDYRVKLISIVRSRVATALKIVRKTGRVPASRGTWRLVGCTLADLVVHLESQFDEGMSWANFGRRGWHVDHIYPVGKADLTDNAQLQAAFNWRNCRPAWESDNLRKHARVTAAAKRHFDELVAFFREEATLP
jgi:DNA-directed RNA polymerase subunit M/transcription elongation factor TFIIS